MRLFFTLRVHMTSFLSLICVSTWPGVVVLVDPFFPVHSNPKVEADGRPSWDWFCWKFPLHNRFTRVQDWGLSWRDDSVWSVGFLSRKTLSKLALYDWTNIDRNYIWFNWIIFLWWTGDLSRVYPASRPMTAGIGSSPTATRPTD